MFIKSLPAVTESSYNDSEPSVKPLDQILINSWNTIFALNTLYGIHSN